eukprot:scaffold28118_cov70-Phaeocystis_antarctica.AAC.3
MPALNSTSRKGSASTHSVARSVQRRIAASGTPAPPPSPPSSSARPSAPPSLQPTCPPSSPSERATIAAPAWKSAPASRSASRAGSVLSCRRSPVLAPALARSSASASAREARGELTACLSVRLLAAAAAADFVAVNAQVERRLALAAGALAALDGGTEAAPGACPLVVAVRARDRAGATAADCQLPGVAATAVADGGGLAVFVPAAQRRSHLDVVASAAVRDAPWRRALEGVADRAKLHEHAQAVGRIGRKLEEIVRLLW